MRNPNTTLTKRVSLALATLLLLLSVGTQAKPQRAPEEGMARTEFKFGPAALPPFTAKEGEAKLEERPGSISAGSGSRSVVLSAHLEGLEVNDVVHLLGDASLESGEAVISFQVDGVTRSRTGLTTANRQAAIQFAVTLPRGEGDIVIELAPNSSIVIHQLRMERLL